MGRRVLRRHIWGYAVCLCPIKALKCLLAISLPSTSLSIKATPGLNELKKTVVSTCNILAEYVVAGYGLISLPSTVKAILS